VEFGMRRYEVMVIIDPELEERTVERPRHVLM
jgi:ribosomal protein S6